MICRRRGLLVVAVWFWSFLGVPVVALFIACIEGVAPTVNGIMGMLSREPYLASYIEFACCGGLPLAVTLLCREDFVIYGLRREGLVKSLLLSSILAVFKITLRLLSGGFRFVSFNLPFPLNLWYAFFGVFAYGPLEVFFVVWLIVNTDRIFGSLERMVSPGLIITVLVFGLSHVVFSPGGGLVNAISVTITFFILGLIYKYTGNSIGPMIAWTLMNGFIPYLVIGCLT